MSRSFDERAAADRLPAAVDAVVAGSTDRRRAYARLLGVLRERDGRCSATALAAALARSEDNDARRSAYLAVRREYVPTLAALDVVAYDGEDGTVTLLVE